MGKKHASQYANFGWLQKKALPETAIKVIVYQFRYLINDKKASDEELSWHLSKTLSNLGIKVDYIPEPSPWRKKKLHD